MFSVRALAFRQHSRLSDSGSTRLKQALLAWSSLLSLQTLSRVELKSGGDLFAMPRARPAAGAAKARPAAVTPRPGVTRGAGTAERRRAEEEPPCACLSSGIGYHGWHSEAAACPAGRAGSRHGGTGGAGRGHGGAGRPGPPRARRGGGSHLPCRACGAGCAAPGSPRSPPTRHCRV